MSRQYTRILCLGDSITYGARATWGRTYPVILEELLSIHAVPAVCLNAGVNGETSWQIAQRAWDWLGGDAWIKVCVAMFGTNDSKPKNRTPDDIYMGAWARLLRFCENTDTILIACEIPDIHPIGQPEYDSRSIEYIHHANEMLLEWCTKRRITYIGGLYNTFQVDPDLLADGIHPNNRGNLAIANAVYKVLGQPLPHYEPVPVDPESRSA